MSKPLVSIIVPVFNDQAFLPVALASIANQTLHDFEVVVSDDASTDGSREIALEFSQHDSRFKLRINPTNLGMTRNWNTALKETRGRYVVKLDSDDAFREEMLERMVVTMESEHKPMVVYCRALDCDENLVPFSSYRGEQALIRARIDPLRAHCRQGHEWYGLCFDDFQLWHSNAQMHRHETLVEMGGWDESWGCASDTDLILRVLERNEAVCHIPYAGVLYRQRPGSVSDQYRRQAWLKWESSLIHLDSLSRYRMRGGKMTSQLSKAWWRFWQNWKALQREGDDSLQTLREDIRNRLVARAAEVPRPTWSIRLIESMRQCVWDGLNRPGFSRHF